MREGATSAEAELMDDVHRGWGAGRRRDRLASRHCVGLEVATTREELKGPERK